MDNGGSYLSGRKVFVGGLAPNLSLALFDDHFKQYVFALPHVSLYIDNEVLSLTQFTGHPACRFGAVESSTMMADRGFGFVTYVEKVSFAATVHVRRDTYQASLVGMKLNRPHTFHMHTGVCRQSLSCRTQNPRKTRRG